MINPDNPTDGESLRLKMSKQCSCPNAPNAVPIGRIAFDYRIVGSDGLSEDSVKAKCIQGSNLIDNQT